MGLGNKIKQIRELRNFSQAYMARKLGISQGAYSSLENDKTKISYERVSQIAVILETEASFIINFSPDKVIHQNAGNATEAEIQLIKAMYRDIILHKVKEIEYLKQKLMRMG